MSSGSEDAAGQDGRSVIDHLRTAEDMLASSRKRKAARRKAIEHEYEARVEKASTKLAAIYEEREQKLVEARNAQWDRLDALLKERRYIEAKIFANLKSVEQAHLNLSSGLVAMYEGRLEEIAEVDTTGIIAKHASKSLGT